MFWNKARKKYSDVTAEDQDIIRYSEVMDDLQKSGYDGITGIIQDLGHKFVSKYTSNGKTLEIGFGRGRQALFYKGAPDNYYPIEINEKYIDPNNWDKFKNARIADATQLPFNDNMFDNVVSIYNLEHITKIDLVLHEVNRVLKADGKFIIALPCEDGLAWNTGRELTTRRTFIKKYNINYDKVIAYEHVHNFKTLRKKMCTSFVEMSNKYYPFMIPSYNLNLVFCGIYKKKV